MNVLKLSLSAVALSLTIGAASADNAEPATLTGCIHMQKKVTAALDANQASPNYADAQKGASDARTWCSAGMYKNGVDGYAKVLHMLGAG